MMILQNFKKMLVIFIGFCLFQFAFLFAQVQGMNSESTPQKQLVNSKDVLITGWGGLSTGTAYNDMVAPLESLGYTVTGSNTFPDDLTGYEIMILVGGGSSNEDIPEAAVDDFVNAGNGLIIMEGVTHFEFFDATANSNPIESTIGWDVRNGSTVTMSQHVLSQGLSQTCTFSGYSSQITLKKGAVVPIEWDDGEPFAVTWTWGNGKVVYFNNAWIWYADNYWSNDVVNGKKLMENALDYIDPKDVLITGWGYLSTGAAYNDMVSHLEDLGLTVTGSDTFPADLTGYEIMILVGGGSANEDIPEAAVDDFVNAGNGLIIMEGVIYSGDFDATANSNPIESTTGWDVRDGSTVTMPEHILSQGLSETCSFYGYSSQITLKEGAVVPIEWDDGEPFAVTWTWGNGKVVYFNDLWTWYSGNYWSNDLVNGKKLMENTLNYIYNGAVSAIEDNNSFNHRVVSDFILEQNYPNPFNPSTTIKYSLSQSENVRIEIFNTLGQKIQTLLNKQMPTGHHEIEFNATNIPSGVYLYSIRAGDFYDVKKMILLR